MRWIDLPCLTVSTLFAFSPVHSAEPPIRVNGSSTVNPVVTEAAEILREEKGIQIQIDTQGGSTGGINALAEGRAEVAMLSRPLHETDRQKNPTVDFTAHHIGEDAVALIVAKDIWEGGVQSLTREQAQGIYEKKTTNWSALGGPDRRIAFFNKEPGRGTWEIFATWLYGKYDKAPPVAHPEVGANEEARSKVATTRGALSQLSASWVDQKSVFALGIRSADGKISQPTAADIANGDYPLSRSLWVITNGKPKGNIAGLVNFLKSERGQELVRKNGYLSLNQIHP